MSSSPSSKAVKNMKHMKHAILLLSVALLAPLSISISETTAEAAPPPPTVMTTSFTVAQRMAASDVVHLRQTITQARAVDTKPFINVNAIIVNAPSADAKARGHKAATAQYLSKLGPVALMPILEMLVIEAPKGIPAEALPSVRRDLIEAAGLLKDAKALPVLTPILNDKNEDEETTRTTAEAIARIGTDEAVTRLLAALDASTGDRTRGILSGMGDCHRLKITDALATHFRTVTDEATAKVIARSLGRTGNAWAWQTMSDRSDEAVVREAAARALVDGFVRQSGDAREAAQKAILVVDDTHTTALIAEARKNASPETQKALDALSDKLAHNPAR